MLAFPRVYGTLAKIQITIVSMTNTTVTLTSQIPGVNRSIFVEQSSGRAEDLPTTLAQTSSSHQNKYVLVESKADISVTVSQSVSGHTSDGYLAIPTKSLSSSYVFMSDAGGVLELAAVSDNTHVSIYADRGIRILTLDKLQVYQMTCSCLGYVNASDKVMLIYGAYKTNDYTKYTTSHMEEAFGINNNYFIFIVPKLSMSSDQVVFCETKYYERLTISSDHNKGTFSGDYTYIYQFTTAHYIKSDKPQLVHMKDTVSLSLFLLLNHTLTSTAFAPPPSQPSLTTPPS